MKIGLVSREYPPETSWGGIGTYTHQLAHGLADRGHEVHVVTQSLTRDAELADGLVHVHRVYYRSRFRDAPILKEWGLRLEHSYRVAQRLRAVIERHRLDIVEAPNFSAEGFIYSFRRRVPMVTRLHTHFSELVQMSGWRSTIDHRLSCALEDAAVLRSDMVTCSTTAHSRLVACELGIDPAGIERIPLGVQLPNGEVGSGALKLAHPAVLFVGRLEKRKGVHVLFQAIPRVLEARPGVHFYIIGRDTYNDGRVISVEGNESNSFRAALLREFPPAYRNRVHLLGYVEPGLLAQYYRACDLFVGPSLYESFGLIYLEAMSHGKPVVACSVGGVPEVVEDGVTGCLVPPEDPVGLASALQRLLSDAELRLEMGRQARLRVEAHFSRERMVDRTLAIYRRVVETNGGMLSG